MNPDKRIDELEREIREIAASQLASQQRLQQLLEEVRAMRSASGKSHKGRNADEVPAAMTGGPSVQQDPGTNVAGGLPQAENGNSGSIGLTQSQTGVDDGGRAAGLPQSGTRIDDGRRAGRPPQSGKGNDDGSQSGLEHFIGLRLIHVAGIIVLLTGISIGIRYAINKDLISPLARIGLAYGAGLVLFILSVRLRARYNFFSAILFSGSMACCYFTTYGAIAYYGFISQPLAFWIMVALTVFTVLQSIRYNRIEIAAIGLVGAYGIPFLVSSSAGRYDLLFTYILLINVAVVFLAFRKEWKAVSRLAMLITWSVFIGWLLLVFKHAQQGIAITFSAAFYLLFLADAVTGWMFRKRRPLRSEVWQVAVVNALLYVSAVRSFGPDEETLFMVTGLMSLYVAVMAIVSRFVLPDERGLRKSLSIQSIGLLTLFFLFRWDGITVTLCWIGLSIGLFVWGVYLKESWPRVSSVVLIAITLLKLITVDAVKFSTGQRILSFIVIGILLLSGSFYYQRFNLKRQDDGDRHPE